MGNTPSIVAPPFPFGFPLVPGIVDLINPGTIITPASQPEDGVLFKSQQQAVLDFFKHVETGVVSKPGELKRAMDEVRKVNSTAYQHFREEIKERERIGMSACMASACQVRLLGVPGSEGSFRRRLISNYSPVTPGIIMLLNESIFYNEANFFTDPGNRKQAMQETLNQLNAGKVYETFGMKSDSINRSLEAALNSLFEGLTVTPTFLNRRGVESTAQFIPEGFIAGLFYSTGAGTTSTAIYVATSPDLITAVSRNEIQKSMNDDFKGIIDRTRHTLENWEQVVADSNKLTRVDDFNKDHYESLLRNLQTDLMKDVVTNFWESEEDNSSRTPIWNDYVSSGELQQKLSLTKSAFKVRLENLEKYYDDFIKLK